jgi:hypothetical protein
MFYVAISLTEVSFAIHSFIIARSGCSCGQLISTISPGLFDQGPSRLPSWITLLRKGLISKWQRTKPQLT